MVLGLWTLQMPRALQPSELLRLGYGLARERRQSSNYGWKMGTVLNCGPLI